MSALALIELHIEYVHAALVVCVCVCNVIIDIINGFVRIDFAVKQ